MEYQIQSLVFPTESKHQMCRELFFRGDNGYLDRERRSLTLSYGQNMDFVTYLNACSYRKWRTYTNGDKAILYLDVQGDFCIGYLGYSKEMLTIERSEFALEEHHLEKRETIRFEFPANECQMIGFELYPLGRCTVFGGYYALTCEKSALNDVTLCIATTTCRKEKFIKKNIELLKTEILSRKDDISDNLYVHVVDNGQTLSREDIFGRHVVLHPNHNAGGSGGFARGMIESLHQDPRATHVLLMDDDVLLLPDSIVRTYKLLRLMKSEYQNHFISGAMLYYEEPFRQHEDIGTVTADCSFSALKHTFDHRLLECSLENEGEFVKQKNEYAGWWYCCIPVSVIEENGLPLPLFIRCDDMEYSLRCNAQIITLNGICIWHMGFITKYNAAFDKYQQCRNLLIDKASSDILRNVDVVDFVKRSYRAEMLKFNYNAAELVLRAFEDFLKGPDFLKTDNGESIVKENAKLNDRMIPLNDMPEADILHEYSCYDDPPRKALETLLYRITYNGHRFWPRALSKKGYAYIAFDHSYQPSKMALHDRLIAVNPHAKTGVIRTIDKGKYKALMARYRKAMADYKKNQKQIHDSYRAALAELTSEEFWRAYLEI